MDRSAYERARGFLLRDGRLLERRLFARLFESGPAEGVVAALAAYRNDDGGFGHALEPDKRCPESLPADVEVALSVLAAAGSADGALIETACDYLDSVSETDGSVPLAFPVAASFPRAEHWGDWTYEPGMFPTAGICGLLHRLGVSHPWLARATRSCWSRLEGAVSGDALPDDAHVLAEIAVFLEWVPDQERAEQLVAPLLEALEGARWYRSDPGDSAYGVTPLHIAPTPESRWHEALGEDLVAAHLDRLERDQQDDGGWPITWEPPSDAAHLEWRGIETLRALRALDAHGRLS